MGKRGKKKRVKAKLERHKRRAIIRQVENRLTKPVTFQDSEGNTVTPIELVFPIVQRDLNGQYFAVGTGFFVHPAGGFVTAKHCLYDSENYLNNCYAIHTIALGYQKIRKIQYFKPHPTADIGIGMLAGQLLDSVSHQPIYKGSLPISKSLPRVGEKVTTMAYPRMKIDVNNLGRFPCERYAGEIVEYIPQRSGKLTSETFVTTIQIKSGASGGPVLRGSSIVGVNSTSFETSPVENPISFITPIHLIFDLELTDGYGKATTVRRLMEEGYMASVD